MLYSFVTHLADVSEDPGPFVAVHVGVVFIEALCIPGGNEGYYAFALCSPNLTDALCELIFHGTVGLGAIPRAIRPQEETGSLRKVTIPGARLEHSQPSAGRKGRLWQPLGLEGGAREDTF